MSALEAAVDPPTAELEELRMAPRIADIAFQAIDAKNREALATFGQAVRVFTIVDRETVRPLTPLEPASSEPPADVQLTTVPRAELIAPLVVVRSLARARTYFGLGFQPRAVSSSARQQSFNQTATFYDENLAGFDTEFLRRSGRQGGSKRGIPDTVVVDLRHTKDGKFRERKLAEKHLASFITDGKIWSPILNQADIDAAGAVLRSYAGTDMTTEMRDRFGMINEERSARLEDRTTVYQDEHPLVYRREAVAAQAINLIGEVEAAKDEWQARGLCRNAGELFFAPQGERPPARMRRIAEAKKICALCPVKQACQEAGRYENFGIWAGVDKDVAPKSVK